MKTTDLIFAPTFLKRLAPGCLLALAVAANATGCGGGDDDDSKGAAGSAGSSRAGSSSAGNGNAGSSGSAGNGSSGSGQGGSAAGSAGSPNGGSAGSGTSGSGNAAGSGGGAATGHCGTPAMDISSDFVGCDGYDPAANGLPTDDRPFDVSNLTLKGAMANAPLAISRNLTDAAVDVEFWGTDSSCGPAKKLLGTTKKLGVECVDTTPMAAYTNLLVVLRGNAGLEDIRVCSNVKCP